MAELIETDYLVVGAGAAGMTLTDALVTHSDASVTLVERRHAPGGIGSMHIPSCGSTSRPPSTAWIPCRWARTPSTAPD